MENFKALLGVIVCILLVKCASSQMISREVLSASPGRILLAKDPPPIKCKVDFLKRDYSALSACKAPFPRTACCEGFKEIACPVVNEINDLRTNCAANMFVGIYHNMPYLPPHYFRDHCIEGPQGIDCLPVFNRLKHQQAINKPRV